MCGRGGDEEKVDKEVTFMERVHHGKNILSGLHASSFVCKGVGIIWDRFIMRQQKEKVYYAIKEGIMSGNRKKEKGVLWDTEGKSCTMG